MPISYDVYCRSLNSVIMDESLRIPDHQRPQIWSKVRQEQLIDTIMRGRPMPTLIVRETIESGERVRWLEDGQQRYMSMKNFYNNVFAYNNTYYRDFTEYERVLFLTYKIPILTFENATLEEAIEMFDNFQNGVALTPGQRFWARKETPLVKYAIKNLLTPGTPFYERSSAVWGSHVTAKDTKTKRFLMNVMAIVGGVAHGVDHITMSYDVLGPILNNQFDTEMADSRLDMLLKVYERVAVATIFTPDEKKAHWPVGTLTGYVLASLINDPTEENISKWVKYISDSRQKANKYADLHMNMPSTRSWNALRWRIGYENVFVNHVIADNDEAEDDSTVDEE
jgi:hypothetical protein